MIWCICLRMPGTGVEMRERDLGTHSSSHWAQITDFCLIHGCFTMDKCTTKTIPSPILSKPLPKNAQLIQQTGNLKLTERPQAQQLNSNQQRKFYALHLRENVLSID